MRGSYILYIVLFVSVTLLVVKRRGLREELVKSKYSGQNKDVIMIDRETIFSLTKDSIADHSFDVISMVEETRKISSPFGSTAQLVLEYKKLTKSQIKAIVEVFNNNYGDIDVFIQRNSENSILYREMLNVVKDAKG